MSPVSGNRLSEYRWWRNDFQISDDLITFYRETCNHGLLQFGSHLVHSMGSWKIIPKLDSISELFPRKKSQPIYTRVQSNIRMEVLGDCTEMGLSLDIISEIFLARNQYIVRFCVYRFSAYADHLRQNLKKCRFRPKKSLEHSQKY